MKFLFFSLLFFSLNSFSQSKYTEAQKDSIREYLNESTRLLEIERDSLVKIITEQEAWTKYENLGSPIAFLSAFVTSNDIGNPEANIRFFSISKNTIDAFSVSVYCYNNYNKPVYHYAYSTNVVKGISQIERQQGIIDEASWDLFGHENTTKIKVVLNKVHFTNGKTWLPLKGKIVSIKSF